MIKWESWRMNDSNRRFETTVISSAQFSFMNDWKRCTSHVLTAAMWQESIGRWIIFCNLYGGSIVQISCLYESVKRLQHYLGSIKYCEEVVNVGRLSLSRLKHSCISHGIFIMERPSSDINCLAIHDRSTINLSVALSLSFSFMS